jgi:transposase
MTRARELLGDIRDAYVAGDSAYSSRALVEELEARGCKVVIDTNPTHRPRLIDSHLYGERFLVEHFFQRIKRLRRISMRFEKLARNYLSFVYLAAALVWLA